ncbi:MAG: hypothetical protein QOH68_636 [Nocardioidaceae bacterium]|nr:hypothetical protein [Nocardioidaceae bacterium]
MYGGQAGRVILLLQADVGAAEAVAAAVSAIPGVVGTAVTSGPYDVIGHVRQRAGEDPRAVLDAVRQVGGLSRLCVCRPVR